MKGVSPGPRQLRWCNTPAPAADNMKQYCDRNGRCGLEGKICMGGLMLVLTVLRTFIFFAPNRCIRHLKVVFTVYLAAADILLDLYFCFYYT